MFYLINKPLWITSFDVIRRLRKIIGTRKIWHTGTLDPLASWCLLIATDNSTKLIPMLEKLEKSYTFKLRVDWTTPSLDLDTPIQYHDIRNLKNISQEALVQYLADLDTQVPPAYSALKVDWVRSYELARKWELVKLKERPIKIQDIIITQFAPPEFELSLSISSGWYIRSLAMTIGQLFWVPGWYITELRRDVLHIQWWPLTLNEAQDLEDFRIEKNIPYTKIFPHIPMFEVNQDIFTKLQQWKILSNSDITTEYNIWQKIFLKYWDTNMSLVECSDIGFQIIRNNV